MCLQSHIMGTQLPAVDSEQRGKSFNICTSIWSSLNWVSRNWLAELGLVCLCGVWKLISGHPCQDIPVFLNILHFGKSPFLFPQLQKMGENQMWVWFNLVWSWPLEPIEMQTVNKASVGVQNEKKKKKRKLQGVVFVGGCSDTAETSLSQRKSFWIKPLHVLSTSK